MRGLMEDFYTEKKIYYHDTDCGGVVYYANYLKHLEEARTEYLLSKGISLQEMAEKDIWFVVAKVEIEYKSPARYQDTLKILTRIEKTKIATMKIFQKIMKDNTIVVEAYTTLVCVGKDFKPKPLPEEIKKSLD
ncbi:MAG: YbgC/FadM family acyl-CoA thioesterase [Nitrospira sp.]|nr:YbgC/FadM family acyl-CoA thioesterase [Nitrospira sp.]